MKNDERLRAALEEARFEMEEGMHLHAYEILRDAVGEVVKMPNGLEQVAEGFGDIADDIAALNEAQDIANEEREARGEHRGV